MFIRFLYIGFCLNILLFRIQHSRVAIIKPKQKTTDQALEEVEEAIRINEARGDGGLTRGYSPADRSATLISRRRSRSPILRRRSPSPRRRTPSPIRRRSPSYDERSSSHRRSRHGKKSKHKHKKEQ